MTDDVEIPVTPPALGGVLAGARFDHVGIVVRDLEAALEAMGVSLGVEWAEPFASGDRVIWFEDGQRRVNNRAAFSTTTSPRFEVVCPADIDDPWFRVPPGGLVHHLSYHTDNIAATSRRLARLGYPLGLATDPEGDVDRSALVMHRSPFGPAIELISTEVIDRVRPASAT